MGVIDSVYTAIPPLVAVIVPPEISASPYLTYKEQAPSSVVVTVPPHYIKFACCGNF